jgi:hypothetical protein
MPSPPPRKTLIPQARQILAESGWTSQQASLAVPDKIRPASQSRTASAKRFLIPASQTLVPKLGRQQTARALSVDPRAVWRWAGMPHQDPPPADSATSCARRSGPTTPNLIKFPPKKIITSKLIELIEDGFSVPRAAAEFRVSPAVIRRRLRELKRIGEYITGR